MPDVEQLINRTIRFPQHLDDKLREESFRSRVPITQIVLECVEERYKKGKKK